MDVFPGRCRQRLLVRAHGPEWGRWRWVLIGPEGETSGSRFRCPDGSAGRSLGSVTMTEVEQTACGAGQLEWGTLPISEGGSVQSSRSGWGAVGLGVETKEVDPGLTAGSPATHSCRPENSRPSAHLAVPGRDSDL